jgi:hypothetical protein
MDGDTLKMVAFAASVGIWIAVGQWWGSRQKGRNDGKS